MRKIGYAMINGRRHRIVWRPLHRENALGTACTDLCEIEIDPGMNNELTTEILVHEYLHRAFPDVEERKIELCGSEIATILSRSGLIAEDE